MQADAAALSAFGWCVRMMPVTSPGMRHRRARQRLPIAGPLPKCLELTLGDQIYIAKQELPPALRNRLLRLAAFQNPEFYKAQAMRLPTYGKPRIIACAEDHGPAYRPAARVSGRSPSVAR